MEVICNVNSEQQVVLNDFIGRDLFLKENIESILHYK